MRKSREVVLSLGGGYKFYHLKPLFHTLKNTGYSGDFIFFQNGLSRKTIEKLERYKAKLISFDLSYPFVSDPEMIKFIPNEKKYIPHPKTIRYILYKAFLEANRSEYDRIFICDSRDVIFQKSPFLGIEVGQMLFTAEDDAQSIGDNFYNAHWIKNAFGESTLNELKDKLIICSGTTYGSIDDMISYLDQMISVLIQISDRDCKDQGVHNYLIHSGRMANYQIIPDDHGPVSTLSAFKPEKRIRLNDHNLVINVEGKPTNVVHQYDRFWKLLWKYNKRDFVTRKWNYIKQFLLAIKQNGLKKKYLKNLKVILIGKMVEKFNWS